MLRLFIHIYAPKGQAGEYVRFATNPYRVADICAYCYVPKVLRMDREEFTLVANVRPGYIANLRKDALNTKLAGIKEQVMFSFTTDPYPSLSITLKLDSARNFM